MKHNMNFEKSGKCFVCGEDTKLLIHKECGKKMDKLNKKKKGGFGVFGLFHYLLYGTTRGCWSIGHPSSLNPANMFLAP